VNDILGKVIAAIAGSIITIILTPIIGPAISNFFQSRKKALSETPTEIFQWYSQFENPAIGQDAARNRFYDKYVKWPIAADSIEELGHNQYRVISTSQQVVATGNITFSFDSHYL
jgi:hypothetical protein